DSMEAFMALKQPPLSPPAWLFPVAWTTLYTLMGISSYLTLTSDDDSQEVISTKVIYYAQLIVNFLWPTFFFNFGWRLFSFFWLLLLWGLVIIMIKRFAAVSKVAAALNIPYILWLTFAAYLNFGVWWLNR
ncbi:MAG: tryptophan-rich sensory protein, partial [Lachnospira sp.]|nr:tryptophan-rich sensory protein [Lachnospira sp.]